MLPDYKYGRAGCFRIYSLLGRICNPTAISMSICNAGNGKRKRIINPYTKCCESRIASGIGIFKLGIKNLSLDSARSDLQSDRYKYEHL